MIFVTVGSQKFQFNRLLKEIDKLIEKKVINEEVFAQTGYSDYRPLNYKFKNFLDRDEFSKIMEQSTIVITHGGTGAIIGAVKKEKKVIAVPRLKKYGEHVDNHQVQIIDEFENMNLICTCKECEELSQSINEVKVTDYHVYKSNTKRIINSLDDYLKKL